VKKNLSTLENPKKKWYIWADQKQKHKQTSGIYEKTNKKTNTKHKASTDPL
jgi:4-diphosphocytidyl-2C-methyl-D-erythritol kinase